MKEKTAERYKAIIKLNNVTISSGVDPKEVRILLTKATGLSKQSYYRIINERHYLGDYNEPS